MPEQKKMCGTESNKKETTETIIYASAAGLLHIRVENLNCFKYRHCRNEAREIDCLYCREVNAMLIPSAKIQNTRENITSSSF